MLDDAQLLREYVETGSGEAFRQLVARHVDFVYATALRRVNGDAHLAQDVSQLVFVDLARKAAALRRHPFLPGWLHRSTRYAAVNAAQARERQRRREQEASTMDTDEPADALHWADVRPALDAVLDRLGERERDAVLLRFLEGRSFAEVGQHVAASEDGARMLVARALEKMRRGFERRGIRSTIAALSAALSGAPTVAAPAGLATSTASAALAAGTGSGSALGLGLFVMSKTKIAIIGAALAAFVATTALQLKSNGRRRAELAALEAASSGSATLARENRQLVAQVAGVAPDMAAVAEMARLRQRAAILAARPRDVTDAQLKPASTWTNAGRETLGAATETFHWALYSQNLDEVAKFVTFTDDTPQNRAALLAQVSEAVRNRYGTPERIWAAAMFGVEAANPGFGPRDAFQVFGEGDRRNGGTRVRYWYVSGATGQEHEGGDSWQESASGWTLAPIPVYADGFKLMKLALGNLDPATGDFRRNGAGK